jgi:hypothetical protein
VGKSSDADFSAVPFAACALTGGVCTPLPRDEDEPKPRGRGKRGSSAK